MTGTVASTTGTAPRSPAHDRNACSRHGNRNGVTDTSDRQRPGHEQQDERRRRGPARRAGAAGRARRAARAGRTGRSARASRGASANPRTAGRCGSRMLPSTSAGDVRREEARAVQRVRRAVREDDQGDDADREEAGRRQATRRSSLRPEPADGEPDRHAADQLEHREQHEQPPRVRRRRRGRSVGERDDGMTTGASLKPDSASSSPASRRGSGTRRSTEKTAAASVEDSDRADEQRDRPAKPETGGATPCRRRRPTPATPTVDRTAAGATTSLIRDQRVVSPPSARMRTRARVAEHPGRAAGRRSPGPARARRWRRRRTGRPAARAGRSAPRAGRRRPRRAGRARPTSSTRPSSSTVTAAARSPAPGPRRLRARPTRHSLMSPWPGQRIRRPVAVPCPSLAGCPALQLPAVSRRRPWRLVLVGRALVVARWSPSPSS